MSFFDKLLFWLIKFTISFILNISIIFFILFLSDSLNTCEINLSSFFSEITIVSSPFNCSVKGSKSLIFFLMNSSYTFDISLQNTIFLSPKKNFNSGIILLTFLADTKNTKVQFNLSNFFNSFIKRFFFSGKKP